PSKPSSQQSPKPSPKSVHKSAKTTSQTKAIAANHESALIPRRRNRGREQPRARRRIEQRPKRFTHPGVIGVEPCALVCRQHRGLDEAGVDRDGRQGLEVVEWVFWG